MSRVTVYTAITDDRDLLREPEVVTPGVRYVCMSDYAKPIGPWEIIPVPSSQECPVRRARQCKIICHNLLDTDISIWMDATYIPRADMWALANCMMMSSDVATFKHFCRRCVYDEASEIIAQRLDDPVLVNEQMKMLQSEKYPFKAGLSDTSILIRRHTDAVSDFCATWWDVLDGGSRRDQLSFDYARWKHNVRFANIPGTTREHDRHRDTFQPYFAVKFHETKRWTPPVQTG